MVAVLLPKILLLSLRKKLVDPMGERKVHHTTASRLGGLAFFPAVFISVVTTFSLLNIYTGGIVVFPDMLMLELTSMMMLYLVGLYDDLIGLKYSSKFMVQIVTALLVVISGSYIMYFYGVDTTVDMPIMLGVPMTILLIVFITNSINLIDGIDGLASMLSFLALVTYGGLLFAADDYVSAALCFATAGALAPFWYHNVFGFGEGINSRIFMGDGGALVIGFILSVMAIKVWNLDVSEKQFVHIDLFHILAYSMLFVPCLDVVRVVVHRYRLKQPLFLPDKSHIHHKFIALGFSHRKSLWFIVGIQLCFVLINVLLSFVLNIIYIFVIDLVVWTIMHIFISKIIYKRNE
ncbi:MAG: MraY family glycosyltransferase [Rikenellaceae bacterium]